MLSADGLPIAKKNPAGSGLRDGVLSGGRFPAGANGTGSRAPSRTLPRRHTAAGVLCYRGLSDTQFHRSVARPSQSDSPSGSAAAIF